MSTLIACAVQAECDAIASALPEDADVRLVVVGVGPAAAAAATAAALSHADSGIDLVVCAGIGGGFAPLALGDVAVASVIAFADLGVAADDGFIPVSQLGFGVDSYAVPLRLAVELADRCGGHLGSVLTVATVTGSADRAHVLAGRYPDAVAEGMEGAGVAAAAQLHAVPCAEIRAISNRVGPRRRDEWDVPLALSALGRAVAGLA